MNFTALKVVLKCLLGKFLNLLSVTGFLTSVLKDISRKKGIRWVGNDFFYLILETQNNIMFC